MKKSTRKLCFNILTCFIIALLMIIVAVQAISDIRSGNYAGGFRYDWQPLGPGIQLTALSFMLVGLAVVAWQRFRGRNK
jgi:uncharacterized integral membrane protein